MQGRLNQQRMTTTEKTASPQNLKQAINEILINSWEFEGRLDCLTTVVHELTDYLLDYGEQHQALLEKEITSAPTLDQYQIWHFHYEQLSHLKGLLVLLRDVLMEQYKGVLLLRVEKIEEAQLKTNWQASVQIIKSAWQRLRRHILPEEKTRQRYRNLQRWKHQELPWEVYRKQFKTIKAQAVKLKDDYVLLLDLQKVFSYIRQATDEYIDSCDYEVIQKKREASDILQRYNEGKKDAAHYTSLLNLITKTVENKQHQLLSIDPLKNKCSLLLDEYKEEQTVVVDKKGGWLLEKKINPHTDTMQWLEAEIIPLLYEIWESAQKEMHQFEMMAVNIKNQLTVLKKQSQTEGNVSMLSLKTYVQKIEKTQQTVADYKKQINQNFEKHFCVTELWKPHHRFLPVSLQSSINKTFSIYQTDFWIKVKQWWRFLRGKGKQLSQLLYKNQQNGYEQIVAHQIVRSNQPQNDYYTNIFLTKGYVGNTFFVGRQAILQQVRKSIEQWKAGFRGSAVLTGTPLSGKSVLVKKIDYRLLDGKVFHLLPDSSIDIWGRKIKIEYDWEEALRLICAHQEDHPVYVVIDDLEQWWSPKTPLFHNINRLIHYMNRHASKVFFLATTSQRSWKYLCHLSAVADTFQTTVDISRIDLASMQEAIEVRHSATQKELVNDKGKVVSKNEFDKEIRQIYRAVAGNIGQALYTWSASTHIVGEHQVQHQFTSLPPLDNFMNKKECLLLESILLQKSTNEYRLQALFGPAFGQDYVFTIRRLINIGLLQRTLDGHIEINPLLINKIDQLLT